VPRNQANYAWVDRYATVGDFSERVFTQDDFPRGTTSATLTAADGTVWYELNDGFLTAVRYQYTGQPIVNVTPAPPIPDDPTQFPVADVPRLKIRVLYRLMEKLAPAPVTMAFPLDNGERYYTTGGIGTVATELEAALLTAIYRKDYGGTLRPGNANMEVDRRTWTYRAVAGGGGEWAVLEDRRSSYYLNIYFHEWAGHRRVAPRTPPANGTLGSIITVGLGATGHVKCAACRTTLRMYIHNGRRWGYCTECGVYVAADVAAAATIAALNRFRAGADRQQRARRIHNYSYKPDPRFFGTDRRQPSTLYFGIEHEFEVEKKMHPESFMELVEKQDKAGLLYGKSDGSLKHGVELVSHPMTFEYFQEKYPAGVADLIAKHGQIEWDGRRQCGVHIHMSRDAFGKPYHLYKFLHFIYSEPALVQKIAGREGCVIGGHEMCSYDRTLYGSKMVADRKNKRAVASVDAQVLDIARGKNMYAPRYMAANVSNRTTIELRVFASTVNHLRMRAFVQFADAAFYFTREGRMKHPHASRVINRTNFEAYVEKNRNKYPDLKAVLEGKATHDIEPVEYLSRLRGEAVTDQVARVAAVADELRLEGVGQDRPFRQVFMVGDELARIRREVANEIGNIPAVPIDGEDWLQVRVDADGRIVQNHP